MPLSIADFQAVMFTGAIVISGKLHQLSGLIGLQIGQKIYLAGGQNIFCGNIRDIKTSLSVFLGLAQNLTCAAPKGVTHILHMIGFKVTEIVIQVTQRNVSIE